jgi:hypothetical protein
MAMIDPSPSSDELQALADLFSQVETAIQKYLATAAGKKDSNFTALTSAALNLDNASDTIAEMQLQLATDQGLQAVGVINQATAQIQHALTVRNKIATDLGLVKNIVAFGAAIAAADIGSIVSSGGTLIKQLAS